jgi:hypothetical protein
MPDHFGPTYATWLGFAAILSTGTLAVIALALLGVRLARSAAWQRAIWQSAIAAVALFLSAEALGLGDAVVAIVRGRNPDAKRIEPQNAGETHPSQREPYARVAPDSWGFNTGANAPPLVIDSLHPAEVVGLGSDGGSDLSPLTVYFETPDDAAIADAGESTGEQAAGAPSAEDLDAAGGDVSIWWPGLLWLSGLGVVLILAVRSRVALWLFRRRQTPSQMDSLTAWAAGFARRLGILRNVAFLEAHGLRSPVAFGLLRPTLVLPAAFRQEYRREEQEAILAHELAHLAGGDPFWQLASDVVAGLLWWNPLVWWMRARLRAASEAAADEACRLIPGGPDALAACLVALGRRLVQSRRLGWLSIEGPGFRSGLGRRVERLLKLQANGSWAPGPVRLRIARVVLPLALVCVTVFSTAWARPQVTSEEGETTMTCMKISWQRSLAAVAMAAWLGSGNAAPAAEQDGPKPDEKPPIERSIHPAHAQPDAKPDAKPDAEHAKPRGDAKPSADKVELNVEQVEIVTQDGKRAVVVRQISPADREFAKKRAELAAKVQEIHKRLAEIKNEQGDDARELRAKLQALQKELAELAAKHAPVAARGPGEIIGFHAEVVDVKPVPPEERERRMRLVRQAAANLREAGMPDQAERLLREAEAVLSGMPIRVRVTSPEGKFVPKPAIAPPVRVEVAPPVRLEGMPVDIVRQIRELRQELEQLRREMRESRGERRDGDRPDVRRREDGPRQETRPDERRPDGERRDVERRKTETDRPARETKREGELEKN